MDNWLTIEKAAEYLGMGKTGLYSLARSGGVGNTGDIECFEDVKRNLG